MIKSPDNNNNNVSSIIRTGIVLPKKHPTDSSLIYVSFGNKTSDPSGQLNKGIWCNNTVSGFVRYRDASNNPVSYGSYTPIQPYTPVRVEMPNGGVGANNIIGFAPTNTSTPNIDNVEGLTVLGLTPKGSTIEMDDKIGAVRILYNKGSSGLVLAEEFIGLELSDGSKSGKTSNTGIQLRKGSLSFKTKDSVLQFDESGLSVSFNDGGSSMRITRKGVVFEGMETFKVASSEQVSLKGSNLTMEGTKVASLSGNELKVGGKQITNLTGAQININSSIAITLKSLGINLLATALLREEAGLKSTTVLGSCTSTSGTYSALSGSYSIVSNSFAVGAGSIAMDAMINTNTGMGNSIASSSYSGALATSKAAHASLLTMGTTMLTKTTSVSVTSKILADALPGTSEPAMEASGNVSGARDKKDNKTLVSVASSEFIKNRTLMEKYSVVPNIVLDSLTHRPQNASQKLIDSTREAQSQVKKPFSAGGYK